MPAFSIPPFGGRQEYNTPMQMILLAIGKARFSNKNVTDDVLLWGGLRSTLQIVFRAQKVRSYLGVLARKGSCGMFTDRGRHEKGSAFSG